MWGGNTIHEVYVTSNTVGLTNNMDDSYFQLFENWDELNLFIKELNEAGIEAWGQNIGVDDEIPTADQLKEYVNRVTSSNGGLSENDPTDWSFRDYSWK